MKQRSHKWFSRALLAAVLTLAVACGKDSQNVVSTPVNPTQTGTNPLSSDPRKDPRLPQALRNSVGITLNDAVNYNGLKDLAKVISLPVVETFVSLTLPNDRSIDISSQMLIGFEDDLGFWGGLLNSFPGAATRSTDALDIIYTDSELTFRITAGINGVNFVDPKIFYRARQSGETQCQVPTCTDQNGNSVSLDKCGIFVPPATTCKNYMNLGNSAVKQLGTFSAKTSQWLN